MSTKDNRSRLDELFINLGEASSTPLSQDTPPAPLGWTWECDAEGLYTICDSSVENVLGYTPVELTGKPFATFALDADSRVDVAKAVAGENFPVEVKVVYQTSGGKDLPAVVHILNGPESSTGDGGWRGFTQIASPTPPHSSPPDKKTRLAPVSPTQGGMPPTRKNLPLSPTSQAAFAYKNLQIGDVIAKPSALAVPVELQENQVGLLEFIDENRLHWSKEEQQLVKEVALQLSLALESAYLFQQTETQAWELEVLNNMGRDLSETLKIDEIFEVIHKYTSQLMDASNFLIALYSEEENALSFPFAIENDKAIEIPSMKKKRGLVQHVIDSKKPLLISDDIEKTRTSLRLEKIVIGKPAKSWLGVPLLLGSEPIGAIALQSSDKAGVFDAHDSDLLVSIARQGAISVQNAQLFSQTQTALNETQILLTTSNTASQSLIITETLHAILEQIIVATDINTGLVALFNSNNQRLELAAEQNLPESFKQILTEIGLEDTLCELVYTKNEVIYFNSLEEAPQEIKTEELANLGFNAYLGVPIAFRNRVLGTICTFSNSKNLNIKKNVSLLQAIAQQIGVAIENANLFDETQQRSEELALINRIVAKVAASLDLNKSLEVVAEEIGKALNVQTGIALLNDGGLTSTVVASYSPNPDRPPIIGLEIPIAGNPSAEKVLETKSHFIIENAQTNPIMAPMHEIMRQHNIYGMGIFPLVVQDEVVGTIGLDILERGRTFSKNEINLINTIITQTSTAIQNAQLFDEVQRRSVQLQAAAEVSRSASSMLEAEPLLQQTVGLIRDRFNLYYVGIFIIDEKKRWVDEAGRWAVLRAGTGEAGKLQVERKHKLKIGGSSMVGQCVESGKATISQRAPEEMQRFANPLLPDTRSEMALPLISRGTVIGAMSIQDTKINAFSEEDISVFQTMADQVANALQNANLVNQTQQSAKELEILNEMGQVLSSQLNTEDIIKTIYQYVSRLMDTSYFFVAMYDEENDLISFPLVVENNQQSQIPPMKKRQGLTQYVIDTKKSLFITENVEEVIKDLGLESIVVGKPVQSWLGEPLLIGEKVLGVISVQNANKTKVFDEHHQELLLAVARQSATALQNANLFAQTQRQLANLSTIQETTKGLSAALTLAGVVNTLLAHISAAIHVDVVSLYILEDDYLIREGVYPAGEGAPVIGEKLLLADYPLTKSVVESRKSLALSSDDPRLQEHARKAFKEAGVAFNATIPIASPESVLGTISLTRNHPSTEFTDEEIRLLDTLASQAVVAIDNARAYQRIQQAAAEMSMLFNVSQAIGASVETKEIAGVVARNFVEILSIPNCSISLLDQDGDTLRIISNFYLDDVSGEAHSDDEVGKTKSLTDFPTTAHIMQTSQPLVIQASDSDTDLAEFTYMQSQKNKIKTLIILPLAVKGQSIGIIKLESRKQELHFSEDQINLAMTLANQAAVSIDNALLYEEQFKTAEELRELDKLKSQFLANMSHELRTPLNSIIGFSRVIMKGIDGPVTDLQLQDLSAIHESGQHLLTMINDILDISKIESGKMTISLEEIDIPEIIDSILPTITGLIKDKPVKLMKDIQPDLPKAVADPVRIRQVLLNFLSNATKFTDEGQIIVKAELGDSKKDIRVSVIDSGEGISKEDQKKLFKPFSQVDGSSTRETEGTGLGLSISRQLMTMQNGTIGVESDTGKGSTFFFTIPIVTTEKAQEEPKMKTILIIENDENLIDLYKNYISYTNYQIIPFTDETSGEEQAIQYIEKTEPDLITLDPLFAKEKGWEILKALKKDTKLKSIPVIICSILDEKEKGLELGAGAYLTKPILKNDFISAIEKLEKDK